jgi:hypothetical protein
LFTGTINAYPLTITTVIEKRREMKKNIFVKSGLFFILIMIGLTFSNPTFADAANRLGAGVHYWVAMDDIDVDDVDENGYSLIFSYQYISSLFFKIETDLGLTQKGYAGSDTVVWSPQAYFLVGKGLYGGIGIGINYSDGDLAENPFYALRAGIDLEVLPSIFLDINANYRFENWDFDEVKEDVDSDTVTLGAILRLEF